MRVDAKMGAMQRHERAADQAGATLISPVVAWRFEGQAAQPKALSRLKAVLGVIAIFSNITSVKRTAFHPGDVLRQRRPT